MVPGQSVHIRRQRCLLSGNFASKRHANSKTLFSTEVVQATIKRESAEQAAEAKLYSETRSANGSLYKEKQAAEARLFTDTKSAEGLLYKQRQDAEANCKKASVQKDPHYRS